MNNNVSLIILQMTVTKVKMQETDNEIDELAMARLTAFWKGSQAAVEFFTAGLEFFDVVKKEQEKQYMDLKRRASEEFEKTFMGD